MAPLTRGRAYNPGHVPNDLMRERYNRGVEAERGDRRTQAG